MTFASNGFSNNGFQTDSTASPPKFVPGPNISWWGDVPERVERKRKPAPERVPERVPEPARQELDIGPVLAEANRLVLQYEEARRLALLRFAEADELVRLKMAEEAARRRRNAIVLLLLGSV